MSKQRHPSRSAQLKPHARRRGRRFGETLPKDDDAHPRLQKVLAAAGLGSRRQCEELIVEGRVEVDRQVVKVLGTRVDPIHQEIRVDGEPLPRPKRQYFLLNKPMGVVSTARDPAGRPRVIDLIKSHQRLFPVGRLDVSSEGLILVTNDGELTNLLTHPRYEVEKTYLAQIAGAPTRDVIAQLERGVHLAEGFAHAKRVRIKSHQKQSSVLEIVLDEGRNREVRRLLARVGHKVLRLKRIAIGTLKLGSLAPGEYRPLRTDEVRELRETALAAVRKSRQPSTTSKSAPSAEPKHAALTRRPEDEAERPIPEEALIDELEEAPRHTGTIIGAGEGDWDADTYKGDRPAADKSERLEPKPRVPSVKPLIDVRRGIFPRSHTDDFDEDEFGDEAPRLAPEAEKLDTRAGSPARGKGRAQHGRRRGKPSAVSGAALRQERKPGRKDRGRSESMARPARSKQRTRPGAAGQGSKGRTRGKGRRR